MIRERLIEALDKSIIMDDVTLTADAPRFGTLALEGPAAERVVSELTDVDLHSLADLARQDARVGTIPCTIIRRPHGKFAGAEFLVQRAHLEALSGTLQEKTKPAPGRPPPYTALTPPPPNHTTPALLSDSPT